MATKNETKQQLCDLETVEVSLVDKGANRRVFAIKKSEQESMNDVISAILGTPFEKNEALLERLKKAELSEQAGEAIKSAIKLLSAVDWQSKKKKKKRKKKKKISQKTLLKKIAPILKKTKKTKKTN